MRQIFSILFFLAAQAGASPLYVSLGSCCEVAAELRAFQLRKEAYPFDWLLAVNNEGLVRLLDDDFKYFLDERYFFQDPTDCKAVHNGYYKVEFRHDWPFTTERGSDKRYRLQQEEMRPKYERRIERFRKLREYPGRVYFIRTAFDQGPGIVAYWTNEKTKTIDRYEAISLKRALDSYFPALDFILIVVNFEDESVEDLDGIEGVIPFRVSRTDQVKGYQTLFTFTQYLPAGQ